MDTIQVKCFLFPENVPVSAKRVGEANEIRRFPLTTYCRSELMDKLRTAYGDLLGDLENIKTYWLDGDNDLVGFSNDVELLNAVRMLVDNENLCFNRGIPIPPTCVLKVYIVKKATNNANCCRALCVLMSARKCKI